MRTLTLPREVILPGWRVAVLAYRAARQAGRGHHAADADAVAAFRKVLPNMPEQEAVQEVIEAIAYAVAYHTKWFWRSVTR